MRTLVVAFLSVLLAQAANTAAAPTWLPPFEAGTPLYVNPAVMSKTKLRPEFEQSLQSRAARHGLAVYVIFTALGDDLNLADKTAIHTTLRQRILSQWQGQPGFQSDRSVVVIYIHFPNPAHNAVLAVHGSFINAVCGLDFSRLFSASLLLPMPEAMKFHPDQPEKVILSYLEGLNEDLDSARGLPAPTPQNPPPQQGPPTIFVVLAVGAGLLLCLFLFSAIRRRASN